LSSEGTACGLLAGRLSFGYFSVAVDRKVPRSQVFKLKKNRYF